MIFGLFLATLLLEVSFLLQGGQNLFHIQYIFILHRQSLLRQKVFQTKLAPEVLRRRVPCQSRGAPP